MVTLNSVARGDVAPDAVSKAEPVFTPICVPLTLSLDFGNMPLASAVIPFNGNTSESNSPTAASLVDSAFTAALPRLREVLGQSYASVDVSVGNGSGNSSSNNQSQHSGGQAGTMTMMSDGQDGLNDSTQARDSGRAEGTQAEDESSSLPADDTNTQQNVSPVADNLKPARGLVDAYA